MKKGLIYWFFLPIGKFRYRHMKTEFEAQPEESAVFVSNHSRIDGPCATTLHFPLPHYSWIIAFALKKEHVAAYFYHDVLLGEGRKAKWFYRLLAKLLGPLLRRLLLGEKNVPVYHDARARDTFSMSADLLSKGESILIFAESPKPYSPHVNALQNGFTLLGSVYYRKTGKPLSFYPMYVCRKARRIKVGEPIAYNPSLPLSKQKEEICLHLQKEITRLGETVGQHKPIPFLTPLWYQTYGEYEDNFASYWKMIEETPLK